MPTMLKRVLIACFFAVPSLACAADNSAVAKPAAPPQVAVSAPKAAAVAQTARIGYVDMAKIAAESEQGKALKTLLMARKNKLQGKIDGKKKQLEKLEASIKTQIAKMTPQQREAKSKEFQKKVLDLQKLARESEEEFMSLQDKETEALFKAIEQAAVAHGKANGFAAIVAKKELLYTGSSVETQDVTEALIKELNQAGKKK